jgi:hypothetical protein
MKKMMLEILNMGGENEEDDARNAEYEGDVNEVDEGNVE